MSISRSPLLAFQVAENVEPTIRHGRYDADAQMWVGDTVGAQNGDASASTTTTSSVNVGGGTIGDDDDSTG